MRIGQFEVVIRTVDGIEKAETAEGYVPMRHGEQYQIGLCNHGPGRCNLKVTIDGTSVGNFQVSPYSRPSLERPADGDGRFTFYAAGSAESAAAGAASVSAADRGLVEVVFAPEAPRVSIGRLRHGAGGQSAMEFCSTQNGVASPDSCFGAGVTGQSGHSDQRFGAAQAIVEDVSRRTTITLRLVHDHPATLGPRPLPGRLANAVPPPVI